MNKFAETLKKLRQEDTLTQAELAATIGVSNGSVANWELGKNYPNEVTIGNLCEFFQVSRSQLFGESSPSSRDSISIPEVEGPRPVVVYSEIIKHIVDECIKLTGIDTPRAEFVVDCIYRRWNELKQRHVERPKGTDCKSQEEDRKNNESEAKKRRLIVKTAEQALNEIEETERNKKKS